MTNITLSIDEELKKKMDRFSEINWSGLMRKLLEEKVKQLAWKEEMLARLRKEDESGFTEWTIRMGRKLNEGIAKRLKKEGSK